MSDRFSTLYIACRLLLSLLFASTIWMLSFSPSISSFSSLSLSRLCSHPVYRYACRRLWCTLSYVTCNEKQKQRHTPKEREGQEKWWAREKCQHSLYDMRIKLWSTATTIILTFHHISLKWVKRSERASTSTSSQAHTHTLQRRRIQMIVTRHLKLS